MTCCCLGSFSLLKKVNTMVMRGISEANQKQTVEMKLLLAPSSNIGLRRTP